MNRQRRNFLVITLLLAFIACPLMAAKLPKAAEILPEDTVAMVNVDNFSSLQKQLEKTNVYGIWTDKSMQAFIKDFKENLVAKVDAGDKELLQQLLSGDLFPTGRMTLGLVVGDMQAREADPGVLFVCQWGDNLEKFKPVLDKAMTTLTDDENWVRTAEDYKGLQIITAVEPAEEKEEAADEDSDDDFDDGFDDGFDDDIDWEEEEDWNDEPDEPSSISYCMVDDVLVAGIGLKADAVKFAIDHINGVDGKSLSGVAEFNNAMKSVGAVRDIEAFMNLKKIMSYADLSSKSGGMDGILGFDKLGTISLGCAVDREDAADFVTKVSFKNTGPRTGIFKVFEFQAKPFKVPSFIASDSYEISLVNWDINKAFEALIDMVGRVQPGVAMAANSPLTMNDDGTPGVTLKADILSHIGSQIVISQNAKEVNPNNPFAQMGLICLELKDKTKLENTVAALYKQHVAARMPDARGEFLGRTVYSMPMGYDADSKLSIAFADGWLLIGGSDPVQAAIRKMDDNDSKTVASTQWYKKAVSMIPGNVGMATISNSREAGEASFSALENMASQMAMLGGDLPFDFELLPDYDTIKKYLGINAFYLETKEDGYYMEMRTGDLK